MGAPVSDLDALSPSEMRGLFERLRGEVAALLATVVAQREEIARLKGLKGPPWLRPSGIESATTAAAPGRQRGCNGAKAAKLVVDEEWALRAAVPPGSRLKGYRSVVG